MLAAQLISMCLPDADGQWQNRAFARRVISHIDLLWDLANPGVEAIRETCNCTVGQRGSSGGSPTRPVAVRLGPAVAALTGESHPLGRQP
nr:hypothetical protein [Kibdelosporangium sp. MJ126-NF4]CTQ99167.1 hypothetical protein [Kibdelosporangium sp. MJ126-NF4]